MSRLINILLAILLLIGSILLLRTQLALAAKRAEQAKAILDSGEVVGTARSQGVQVTHFKDGAKQHVVFDFPASTSELVLQSYFYQREGEFNCANLSERPCTMRLTFERFKDNVMMTTVTTSPKFNHRNISLFMFGPELVSRWDGIAFQIGETTTSEETPGIATLLQIDVPSDLQAEPSYSYFEDGVFFRLRLGREEAFASELLRKATP